MFNQSQIKEHMPVVCSNNGQFGTVDRPVNVLVMHQWGLRK